jgi:hypothetical protein
MNYEDFYDVETNEIIEAIKGGIKKDFIEKMEALEKENWELREVKERIESMEYEHEQKLKEMEKEQQKLLRKIKESSFAEIMKILSEPLYAVKSESNMIPKCELCDNNRKVIFTASDGRKIKGPCACNKSIKTYRPEQVMAVSFYSNRNFRDLHQEAIFVDSTDERDSTTVSFTYNSSVFVKGEEDYPDIKKNPWRYIFRTLEDAQAFCDYQNQREVPEFNYY